MKKWFVICLSLFLCNFLNAQDGVQNMKSTQIVFETNKGKIEIALKPDVAPKACENLVKLIETGYYNGIIFHRVIPGFMLQGGDPTGTGTGGESVFGKNLKMSSVMKLSLISRVSLLWLIVDLIPTEVSFSLQQLKLLG